MCGHGSDLIVVWVHIGMKAILSLCGMHMGLTTIVSLCRCVWAETAIASLYWCVQEERSYRCAGMCIGIDRIDIGVYSHKSWIIEKCAHDTCLHAFAVMFEQRFDRCSDRIAV